jgi:hypothetical protein
MKSKDFLNEKWSQKYKKSINCSNPKGFSQKAHCAGRKKNEDVAEGSGDAKYKIKSIGTDKNGDYYISPNTGKKVYKQAKVGDHETPSGEHKPKIRMPYKEGVAEGQTDDDELFGTPMADRIRARLQQLYDADMEPEDAYDQVADEFNIDHEELMDMLDDDLNEYGDTARGQKQLTRVHKRAVDRTIKADDKNRLEPDVSKRDLTAVRKNQATADRAWDRMSDLDVYEADAELAEPPERPRKQQTQTKQKSKLDPNMFGPKLDQPVAKTDPLDDLKRKAGIGGDRPEVNIKKASQADTLSKTAGIGSDDMADMLSRMRNIEIDRDLEAYPEPEPPETLPSVEVNTANLPAVAGQALQAAGVQNPDFHQVANLPGNMADQIRQLGKSLFGSLTMTPTKRIHVVANLGGQGPNSTAEVNAVAGFLKKHGQDLGPGDIDFDNVMPGYKAQTHMFSAAGIRWMLVKDFAGQYIYCWPEEDSHDAQDVIGMNKDTKQLR